MYELKTPVRLRERAYGHDKHDDVWVFSKLALVVSLQQIARPSIKNREKNNPPSFQAPQQPSKSARCALDL
jgi:hypothetical protein